MPFTQDLTDKYSVTVRPAEEVAPHQHYAQGSIWHRASKTTISEVTGYGSGPNQAEMDALKKAKAKVEELEMLVKDFKAAMHKAKAKPKGVKVSLELWKELKAADLIKMRDVAAWGVFDLGFKMPFYEDTCLIYDPELELKGKHYELPPNAI